MSIRVAQHLNELGAVMGKAQSKKQNKMNMKTQSIKTPKKLVVVQDNVYWDSQVRLNGQVIAYGFASAEEAIDAVAEELTEAGFNVPNIWEILEEDVDPTSSAIWYSCDID